MKKIIKKINKFNKERNFEKFHSPKNLSMALSIEVSELMENFQWITQEESRNLINLENVKEEIADCFIYLINLSNFYNLDIKKIINLKIDKNIIKYPL